MLYGNEHMNQLHKSRRAQPPPLPPSPNRHPWGVGVGWNDAKPNRSNGVP